MSSNLEIAFALWGYGVYVAFCYANEHADKYTGLSLRAAVWTLAWPLVLLFWRGRRFTILARCQIG